MNYIPVSLENQANPHAGTSEVTNNAGTSQTPNSNASEEKDEEVELIVVPSAVKIPEEKVESRTSSTNSKKEETLTEPQKEKKDSSTDTLEDNPKIQAFRRELEEIALKHLGTVPKNNSISTLSVNTSSQTVNTGRLDPDDSPMPELEIFHKSETGIFDEALFLGGMSLKALMKAYFRRVPMGELTFFLGLQVKQNKAGIFISQDKYVAEILKKFDLVNVKAAITPMETKVALTKDEEAIDVDVTPKISHLNAVKRIFKYLKGKPNLGLWYPRESPFDLEAFSDSDYGGSNLDRKSNSVVVNSLDTKTLSHGNARNRP
ncbi:putative ribonuclease H-like domain-containing protein [Tanacetum coccineum]|uniref:Ribonuclease H-like domain-containing protein n=1 Tax=Tanacetum coccineum TaxID=301880 RepID=A0ABQ5CA73_9ASTR